MNGHLRSCRSENWNCDAAIADEQRTLAQPFAAMEVRIVFMLSIA
jgi:hypothetical protein